MAGEINNGAVVGSTITTYTGSVASYEAVGTEITDTLNVQEHVNSGCSILNAPSITFTISDDGCWTVGEPIKIIKNKKLYDHLMK